MPEPIWLILSSAFVGQELAAEFGRLPPCFLPVGMKRLFEYQLERLGSASDIRLTLPEGFEVPAGDAAMLAAAGVETLAIPEGLTLGEAVVYACNLIGAGDQPLHILHGDTLIEAVPRGYLDQIGIAESGDGYSWAEVECDANGRVVSLQTVAAGDASERRYPVACGYFGFSSAAKLVRCITRSRGDFIVGVTLYAQEQPLQTTQVGSWYDFGHLRTFYRSRRLVTTARAFNSLQIDGITVRKFSHSAGDKIRAEADWYAALPPPLRVFTARLIDSGMTKDGAPCYDTEYEYLPTLGEVFVFGSLDRPSWGHALVSCSEFLNACGAIQDVNARGSDALEALVRHKTPARLIQFAREDHTSIEADMRYEGRPLPSLTRIAEDVIARIDWTSDRIATVMHGDFCFSNILYNSRVRRIRVIDPRGFAFEGRHDVFGDTRYDLAKLGHSILGRYDHIIAGRCSVNNAFGDYAIEFDQALHHGWVEAGFKELAIDSLKGDSAEVHAIIVSLFLSMLPLHADRPDRQRAFIANALRLYAQMDGG
jgi:hypothetical protein